MPVSLHASSGALLEAPVKSPRSASCLEPFQVRKRPASNIAFLCHKKRPIPIFGKWDAVRNEIGLLSAAGALLSRLLCRLKHAGILYAGSGCALGCLSGNVGAVRWLRACRSQRTAIGKAQLSRNRSRARWHSHATPPPCSLPRRVGSGSGTLLSSEREHRRVKAIRPFPPWPCGPFP